MTATAVRPRTRGDLRIAAVVLVIAAAAWALTADRMAGMEAGPAVELGALGWFMVSWLVMMAAMMLPAVAPVVVAYGRRAGRAGAPLLFVTGYLTTWLAAGLLAYAAIEGVRSLDLGFLAWDEAGRFLAAAVVVGAGLYQLTAPKQACLRRCRDRAALLRRQPEPSPLGALRTGLEHGGFCVGCSWAIMAALFALGVMSVTWMAVVAVLIAAERLLPRPASLAVTVVLLVLGAWVALAPGELPGFAAPDSHPMPAMQMS